jgi:hypothetical protein
MKKTSYMILADAKISKAKENLCEASQVLDDYNREHSSYVTGKIQGEIIKALKLLDNIEGAITEYGKKIHEDQA